MLVQLAGVDVEIIGDAADPYLAGAVGHAAAMTDLVDAVCSLAPDVVIFDVGANLGLSAIAMAIAKPAARIVAFEPSPVTFAYLTRNVAPFANIEPVQAAVSDQPGLLHFHAAAYAAGSHIVGSSHIVSGMPTVDVRAITLDAFTAERNLRPGFIKIDVEGHEPEALAGARAVIERFEPRIYMEFNSWTLNAFAGHSPAAFAKAVWSTFDVEGYADPFAFLHENLTEKGCVSDIAMTLKAGARVPSLDAMSFSQAARDRIAGLESEPQR